MSPILEKRGTSENDFICFSSIPCDVTKPKLRRDERSLWEEYSNSLPIFDFGNRHIDIRQVVTILFFRNSLEHVHESSQRSCFLYSWFLCFNTVLLVIFLWMEVSDI